MYQQHFIADNLYLIRYTIPKQAAVVARPIKVNRILIVDVSGSMWDELPKMREHLKANLVKFAGPDDTVTIIWFSGKGQCGVLMEGVPVRTLSDLEEVYKKIDRWLVPVGLTGFKEPLVEAAKVQQRVIAQTGNDVCSLFFLSDGHDNQWPRHEVLAAAAGLGMSSATVVEYGYYADRSFLAKMAEVLGGEHIFAQDFSAYVPVIEASLSGRPSAKRIEVVLLAKPVGDFAFTMSDGQLIAYAYQDGQAVYVPEDAEAVYYLSSMPLTFPGLPMMEDDIPAMYAAISLYATRMQPEIVWQLLRVLGDVAFIDEYATCFGKQKYSDFQDLSKRAAFSDALRFVRGYDPSKVPSEDAFTLLDLLKVLGKGDRVMLDHPQFKYKRISRARVDSNTKLTAEEAAEIEALVQQMVASRTLDDAEALQRRLEVLKASKPQPLKFTPYYEREEGYDLDGLVIAEDRANASIRVRKQGTVDLSSRLDGYGDRIPSPFPTFIYRNYAILKDGLLNVDVLPVKLSDETFTLLMKEIDAGRLSGDAISKEESPYTLEQPTFLLHLDKFPIVNLRMCKSVNAQAMLTLEYAMVQAQAKAKVFGHFQKELFPKQSATFALLYGPEAAEYLKSIGITDYSGFNPKSVQAEASDVYIAKELRVGLAGLSSLPSMNELNRQIEKGKLNAGATLMKPHLDTYNQFLTSPVYASLTPEGQRRMLETWLDVAVKDAKNEVRKLMHQLAEIKFAIIVGGSWFEGTTSMEENKFIIDTPNGTIVGTVTQKEVEVEI